MEFIRRFEDRAPEYPKMYRESIVERFALMGGGNEEIKYGSGKFFSNVYEMYMYATMLGLRKNYRLPLDNIETQKFIEIRAWKPTELTRFIFMGLLTKSELDFNALEDMEETQIEKELTKLKSLLEEFAHGGFDLIAAKVKEQPYFFEGEYCFLELLDE
jgi:hypothetical protein